MNWSYLALAALALASPARTQNTARWNPEIERAAHRFDLPPDWVRAVMRAESGGQTHRNGRPIISPKGAMGLMQLMPGTWADLRLELGLGNDPHDPRDNILAGAAYLRKMYDRFGYPGLFAAYNAGPKRYARHLSTGRSLPLETRLYMQNVTARAAQRARPTRTETVGLFAMKSAQRKPAAEASERASLFAIAPRRP